MREFSTRKIKNQRNIWKRIFTIIFLFLLILLFIHATYKLFLKKRAAFREQSKFDTQYEDLLRRKHELEKKISVLQSEDGMKEKIKEIYNVGEPGEVIIHITR